MESKLFKRIKDIYWQITAELSEQLEVINKRNSSTSTESLKTYDTEIRLPTLELPTFSGKYDELAFNNLFTSRFHKRVNLDSVQKLHYLMTSVIVEMHMNKLKTSLLLMKIMKRLETS